MAPEDKERIKREAIKQAMKSQGPDTNKKEGDPYLADYDDDNGGMDDWDNTEQYSKYMMKITEQAEEHHSTKPKQPKLDKKKIEKDKE